MSGLGRNLSRHPCTLLLMFHWPAPGDFAISRGKRGYKNKNILAGHIIFPKGQWGSLTKEARKSEQAT